MSGDRREALEIVFTLGYESTDEFEIGSTKFSQLVKVKGISATDALRIIISVMRQSGMAMEFKENGQGKSISADSYLKRVEKRGKLSDIVAGGLLFRFGQVTALKHSFVRVEEIEAGSAISWENWLNPFLAEDGFTQAWVSDVEYDYWQNAKDPLDYDVAGRSYKHLSMKSNGLPPPVERLEIDTSRNPGRWLLKSGYREAIGSTMWLSDLFWSYVGKNREKLLSADWLDVQIVDNGVAKIVSSEHCFCDETTEDVQRKLRAILYG
ncbi:hypothetical protein FACS189497_15100 [Betaproteobacteria bacterium]|nr:hypothetical protein FACS189497_15100 [Betaproteobacteria bacterium]